MPTVSREHSLPKSSMLGGAIEPLGEYSGWFDLADN